MMWKLLSSHSVPDGNELRVQFVMFGISIVLCTVFILQCNPSPLQQYYNYSSIFMKSAVDCHICVFQVHPITASTVNFTWCRSSMNIKFLNIVWLDMFEY